MKTFPWRETFIFLGHAEHIHGGERTSALEQGNINLAANEHETRPLSGSQEKNKNDCSYLF